MFVLPLVIYSILIIYEFIPLYKQKIWPDFWLNFSLGLGSFTYVMIISFGGKVPSPAVPIQRLIESMFGK